MCGNSLATNCVGTFELVREGSANSKSIYLSAFFLCHGLTLLQFQVLPLLRAPVLLPSPIT